MRIASHFARLGRLVLRGNNSMTNHEVVPREFLHSGCCAVERELRGGRFLAVK
ncbi:hypothetical protein SEVIR_6G177801v4 [Setaria viridis]